MAKKKNDDVTTTAVDVPPNEVRYKGVRKRPWGTYGAEIKNPIKKMTERENCIVVVVTTIVTPNEVPYTGVRKRSQGKYKAEFANQKVCVWLGNFDTQEEAARAYDKATRMYHGDKSKLNFPM
ncbi:hypothetical protein MTR67_051412 [Solanum verrucosum]|uniref:AP2/ERF domain-containing protein n=1 Tax=Solanum verrucosum TaxID=315347 RepID=A0AAF0V4A2_SOLVR|nr:hypothetical protein MTR67_051412 [Solanum verrucosum]